MKLSHDIFTCKRKSSLFPFPAMQKVLHVKIKININGSKNEEKNKVA